MKRGIKLLLMIGPKASPFLVLEILGILNFKDSL